MKKIVFSVIFTLCILLAGIGASADNRVSDISIDVTVRDDGSADIVQVWNGTFDEGTENYIPINTDGIEISDFKVSDASGAYTSVEVWNTKAGFNEKARKCGINKAADGIELCFGISEYGSNRYAIEYTVHDFIKSYTDFDGTNFMFINPNMNTFPTDGKIKLTLANGTRLSEENAGIWAFGFDGQIVFDNGSVTAYTDYALSGSNSMIVLLKLNKGIISPAAHLDREFAAVIDRAMEDSSYQGADEEIPPWFAFLLKLIGLAILVVAALVIVHLIKRKRAIKSFYKQAEYFREVPNRGRLEVSHFLAQNYDVAGEDSLIIGAALLSMINKRSIEPQTEENVGLLGKVKTKVNLRLVKEPESYLERRLYGIIAGAAGDDGILQEKELKKYSYEHPKLLEEFVKKANSDGETEFAQGGGFVNGSGNCIKDLSEGGKAELAEVMGLKKYLTDFSLIAEREITETAIWKDYLVYATLFGIADATIKQFKKIYPEMVQELEDCNRNVIIAGTYYHTMHSSYQRALEAQRSSGGGGHSSIGGGGGFSGGGSGGGSR